MPWLVHAFTASGALLAFLAVTDIAAGDLRRAFLWLAASTVVDSVDGVLARLANVKARTPLLNGARLDDIVDYLTFVFAPAFALHHGGFLPGGLAGWTVVAAVLLASALGFSREDAKTADHFFTGFPSYWNIVAVYVAALGLPEGVNAAILLALAAGVFVPIGYVYPSRTPRLRGLTVGLGIVWGLALFLIIWRLPIAPRWLVLTSLAYPAYYVGLSLALHRSRNLPNPRG